MRMSGVRSSIPELPFRISRDEVGVPISYSRTCEDPEAEGHENCLVTALPVRLTVHPVSTFAAYFPHLSFAVSERDLVLGPSGLDWP